MKKRTLRTSKRLGKMESEPRPGILHKNILDNPEANRQADMAAIISVGIIKGVFPNIIFFVFVCHVFLFASTRNQLWAGRTWPPWPPNSLFYRSLLA